MVGHWNALTIILRPVHVPVCVWMIRNAITAPPRTWNVNYETVSSSSSSCEEDTMKQLLITSCSENIFRTHPRLFRVGRGGALLHPHYLYSTALRQHSHPRKLLSSAGGENWKLSKKKKKTFWKHSFVVWMMPKNPLSWTNAIRWRLRRLGL